MSISPQQLVQLQSEIHQLSEEYERQARHFHGMKEQFIIASTKVVEYHNKREAAKFGSIPPSSSSTVAPTTASPLKFITLPSASEVKETNAAEHEAKKRKASAPPAPELVKKLKMATLSSIVIPIDAITISSAPPTCNLENLQLFLMGWITKCHRLKKKKIPILLLP